VNNLPNVATQWNGSMTRESNRGHRVRIPSALTTKPLSHTGTVKTAETRAKQRYCMHFGNVSVPLTLYKTRVQKMLGKNT